MGDEMKQTETGMPSLTLEPELVMEQEKEPEVQAQLMEVTQEMNPVQQKMAQTVLTPEEQQMVEDFAGKIDLENLTQVMQYMDTQLLFMYILLRQRKLQNMLKL